jgi:hypothetical protein
MRSCTRRRRKSDTATGVERVVDYHRSFSIQYKYSEKKHHVFFCMKFDNRVVGGGDGGTRRTPGGWEQEYSPSKRKRRGRKEKGGKEKKAHPACPRPAP